MKMTCHQVEVRMQRSFDNGSLLSDADLTHLKGCSRCCRFFDSNMHFAEQLQGTGRKSVDSLREPDWERIVSQVGMKPRFERPRSRSHRLINLLPKVAAIVLFVGVGGVFGIRQYQLQQARSFLRSDTTEFVSALFSSPLFPQGQFESVSVQPGWFDATSPELSLPAAVSDPAPDNGQGGASGERN